MSSSDLLRHLVRALDDLNLPYTIGGSIASMAYSTFRSTIDIDVVIALGPEDVDRLKTKFPEPDYYLDEAAAKDAVRARRQFNILHIPSAMKIDVIVPADATARAQIDLSRSRPVFEDIEARISPPEDLIVTKLVYYQEGGSDKHLNDIASMLKLSRDEIDLERIESLALGRGVIALWRRIVERVEADPG